MFADVELYYNKETDTFTTFERDSSVKMSIKFELMTTMAGYRVWKQHNGPSIHKNGLSGEDGQRILARLHRLSPLGSDLATGIVNLDYVIIFPL